MAQQPLPVPNIPNLHAAVNEQALTTELSLCANYNVVQIQQQLTAIQASIAESRDLNRAE
jgi:hypothetical protein